MNNNKKVPATSIATAFKAVAVVSFVLVVALMLFLILARYVLGLSVVGLHELTLLFAIQLYMAGALIASRRREHLVVDWLPRKLTGRAGAINQLFIASVTVAITGFFIVWAYRMLSWGMVRPQTTPALRIPLWVPQAAIMIAALGTFAYAIRDLLQALRLIRN